jgi:hypothetical protein
MFSDYENYFFFEFAMPSVQEFERLKILSNLKAYVF